MNELAKERHDAAERVLEISEEIVDLLEEAMGLVRGVGTPTEIARARGYWLANIRIMSWDKSSSEIGLILGFSLFRGQWQPGGFVTSRQELDDLNNFDAGHCGIDPQVQIGERQAIVSLFHIQKGV